MSYNFQKFETTGSGFRYDGIRVMKSYILLTKDVVKRLEGVERLKISFDKEKSAIALTPTDETTGYLISHKNSESYAITCPISRVMPLGRYYFSSQEKEGYIFIAKS